MQKKLTTDVTDVPTMQPEMPAGGSTVVAKPRRRMSPKKILSIVLVVLAVGGSYGTWYYRGQYQALKTDPNAEAKKQTDAYVAMLSKLMELPRGETPTVATISDKSKLADQVFFAKAENGDILFAYTTAMQAILYRPSTNRIINVAPISINQPQTLNQATKKPATAAPKTASTTSR